MMPNECFAYDWIISVDERRYLGVLSNMAQELDCKIDIEAKILECGLQIQRFIMFAKSKQTMNEFIQQAKEKTSFHEWFQVSCKDYPEPSHGMEAWHGVVFHSHLDELYGIGLENQELQNRDG